jgi:hypothetical protein
MEDLYLQKERLGKKGQNHIISTFNYHCPGRQEYNEIKNSL